MTGVTGAFSRKHFYGDFPKRWQARVGGTGHEKTIVEARAVGKTDANVKLFGIEARIRTMGQL